MYAGYVVSATNLNGLNHHEGVVHMSILMKPYTHTHLDQLKQRFQ